MTDPRLQAAFRTVAVNCVLDRAAFQRLKAHPHAAAKISVLARTSPEYQRHMVSRLLAGEPNPFRPIASTLLVYDTVGFYEVISRLHRAVGMVRLEAEYLDQQITKGVEPDRLPDRMLTLGLIAEQAHVLTELLADVEIRPGTRNRKPKGRGPWGSPAELKPKLHAAAALGLIAKNVRNVAVLQPEHRPTADQKELAIGLAEQARQLAVTGRDAPHRAFGRADEACRVRARGRPTRRIITHSEPDGDAIVAAWLAERFLLADEAVEVLFVPRERALGAYRPGDCLVDVGNTHGPAHLFFDHKPPAFPSRHDSCAAKLMWEHLGARGCGVGHLQSLINAVFAGDSLKQRRRYVEYIWSTTDGFHAVLARARAAEETDAGVYRAARKWLDRKYRSAERPKR